MRDFYTEGFKEAAEIFGVKLANPQQQPEEPGIFGKYVVPGLAAVGAAGLAHAGHKYMGGSAMPGGPSRYQQAGQAAQMAMATAKPMAQDLMSQLRRPGPAAPAAPAPAGPPPAII